MVRAVDKADAMLTLNSDL